MRHVRSVALGALFSILAGTLHAQTIPSHFEYLETRHTVGFFGGYLQTDPGDRDVGPTPAPTLGVRYGIHMTGPLTGEVSASYSASERTVYRRPVPTDPLLAPVGDTNVGLVLLQAGFHFNLTGPRTWRGFAPFLLATGGIVTDLAGAPAAEEGIPQDQIFDFGPAFAAGGGLGTDFYLADWLSIRAEATDHLWRLGYPIGLAESAERDSEWVHNFGVSLGGSIHF